MTWRVCFSISANFISTESTVATSASCPCWLCRSRGPLVWLSHTVIAHLPFETMSWLQQGHTQVTSQISTTAISNIESNGGNLLSSPGTVGDSLSSSQHPDVFVSSDGGYNWRGTLRGPHHYSILDSGGLIVAVEVQRGGQVKTIKYGTDPFLPHAQ